MFSMKHKLCDMLPDAGMGGGARREKRENRKVESMKRIVRASQESGKICESLIENNNEMICILNKK